MKRIGILHLTDTLEAGGAERMAVNLVNLLPRERFRSYLCTTRREGLLAALVKPDVGRLSLARQRRFELTALRKLARFIAENRIQLLHAHSTALLVADLVSLLPPCPRVIWHDHYGDHENNERPVWTYRLLTRRVGGVIAVNQLLAEWAQRRLHVPAERVRYIPNFITEPESTDNAPELPGAPGKRIVCVANLRPQKDHFTLLQALALVVKQAPQTHLLLAGMIVDQEYFARVNRELARLELKEHVSVLGAQRNVMGMLRQCDIGVLSSTSEGLPLAVLEYGNAGLPVVTTAVGQCPEVLDQGRAGILVPPAAPERLAAALLELLGAADKRAELGQRLRQKIRATYSPQTALTQICRLYETVLNRTR